MDSSWFAIFVLSNSEWCWGWTVAFVQEEGNKAFLSSIRMRSGTRPEKKKVNSKAIFAHHFDELRGAKHSSPISRCCNGEFRRERCFWGRKFLMKLTCFRKFRDLKDVEEPKSPLSLWEFQVGLFEFTSWALPSSPWIFFYPTLSPDGITLLKAVGVFRINGAIEMDT